MSRIKLTEKAHRNLLYNLVEMESKKTLIVDQWATDLREKEEINGFFAEYFTLLDGVVKTKSIRVAATATNEFPFVAVGCNVTLQDIETESIIEFNIIPPYQEQIDFIDVSILSPMGKALLKKGQGELITVQAPGGAFKYKILSIIYLEQ
ncbi:MAG TPA: GreA/GreB family elongation factor [Bacillota bacterium]|nr:GreA/GreB family elongation factor [Bacillota bacterium]